MVNRPTGNYVLVSYQTCARLNRDSLSTTNKGTGVTVILKVIPHYFANEGVGYAFYRGVYQGVMDLSKLLTPKAG